jgi:hypothetical protein
MDQTRFDQSLNVLADSTGRRDAVRALGAIGTALLAALGLANGSAADKQHTSGGQGGGHSHKNRSTHSNRNRNRNRHQHRNRGNAGRNGGEDTANDDAQGGPTGASGPAGPDNALQADRTRKTKRGPTGPTGPTGPAGTTLATRFAAADPSGPLPVTAGAVVASDADCGGEGQVVACGYSMSATPEQLVNTFVTRVEPNGDRSGCIAQLRRTAEVGSTAGARIEATALCLS